MKWLASLHEKCIPSIGTERAEQILNPPTSAVEVDTFLDRNVNSVFLTAVSVKVRNLL